MQVKAKEDKSKQITSRSSSARARFNAFQYININIEVIEYIKAYANHFEHINDHQLNLTHISAILVVLGGEYV
jgi:ATP phosphoribosyltransferase regulatory subunit HisZ